MPELPEVETVVRDLRPRLAGREIVSVWSSKRRLRKPNLTLRDRQLLAGRRILEVGRRGKWIIVALDSGHEYAMYLVLHLGMTGQLTVRPSRDSFADHTHLVFDLDRREQLRFRDVRRFGCALLLDDAESLEQLFIDKKLGPEPFELRKLEWRRDLQATRRCLKAALLDQRLVAGVGNIYADESLFLARLPPTRLGCDTAGNEAERLRKAVLTVLKHAIERRGSSIRDYLTGNGDQGGYQREFRVYGRTGEPCLRCRTRIECIRLAGRSTHFCPKCQSGQRSAVSGQPNGKPSRSRRELIAES